MNQQLQKVDIASLKSGDEVYIWGEYLTPLLKDKYALFERPLYQESELVLVSIDGESRKVHSCYLYYPPSPQLRPIDLATIKEGMPVVVNNMDGRWSGKVGKISGWDKSAKDVFIDFGGEHKYERIAVGVVFQAPESESAIQQSTTPKELIEYFKRTGTFPPRTAVDEITEVISFTPGQWDN